MQIYLGPEDADIREGIKKFARDENRSLSWAARELIRLGLAVKEKAEQIHD